MKKYHDFFNSICSNTDFFFISDVISLHKRQVHGTQFPFRCPQGVSHHDCYESMQNLMSVWIRRLMTHPES